MEQEYLIDGRGFRVAMGEASSLHWGAPEILSDRFGDLAAPMAWSEQGYTVLAADGFYDIEKVYASTTEAVRRIIQEVTGRVDLSRSTPRSSRGPGGCFRLISASMSGRWWRRSDPTWGPGSGSSTRLLGASSG